ncbi:MAG: adenylate kinase [Anaerolineales bacterium]|nr:adenylate kinase [Anaerolineales bacterium]MCK5634182.1 adenylate kinase [Anaerolineales bacterium]
MYLILLGPPGSGKGTQAERLCKELNLPHVSSGELFRTHLKQESDLGKLARSYIDIGQLVPDGVTIAMVKERLARPDCGKGAILDGFPRTIAQAEALNSILQELGQQLTGVLFIAVPDNVLIERLSGRRICRNCQTPYHIHLSPPREKQICDLCGGELYQRDDDQPGTIKARVDVYHKQTAPLIKYYEDADLLHKVDGNIDIDQVTDLLITVIRSLRL